MTKETYEAMTPYADRLGQATALGWTRMTRKEVEALNAVAQDAIGRTLGKGEITCPHCILRFLKEMDRAYKAYVPPKPKQRKKKTEE